VHTDVIEAYCGALRRLKLTLPAGRTYTGATPLAAQVWPGDDRPVLFAPTVAWLDADERTVTLTIAPAQTTTVTPGTYPVRLGIGASDARAWVPLCLLRLRAAPGTGVAGSVYCTFDSLRRYAGGWLDALYGQGDASQAGYAEERAAARAEFESRLHGRYNAMLGSGEGLFSRSPWLTDELAAEHLLVTEPIARWNALWALHLVCRRQVMAKGDNPYLGLADRYRDEADALLPTITAELDTDDDGQGDVAIPLGTVRILRG
jgi:hypothetical protein